MTDAFDNTLEKIRALASGKPPEAAPVAPPPEAAPVVPPPEPQTTSSTPAAEPSRAAVDTREALTFERQPEPAPKLSVARQRQFEAAVAAHHATAQELEDAQAQIEELKVDLRSLQTECDGLQSQIDQAEQRIQGANVARDQAIAERAVLEALFALVRKVLDEAQLPAAVLNPTRVDRVKTEG